MKPKTLLIIVAVIGFCLTTAPSSAQQPKKSGRHVVSDKGRKQATAVVRAAVKGLETVGRKSSEVRKAVAKTVVNAARNTANNNNFRGRTASSNQKRRN